MSGYPQVPGQPPSRRQLDLLRAFAAHVAEHGVPPTARELIVLINVASTNSVACFTKALVAKGLMERVPKSTRGMLLTDSGWKAAGYSPPQPPRLLASEQKGAEDVQG